MKAHETLEFNVMKQKLAELSLSANVKSKITALTPYKNIEEVRYKLKETTEAKQIVLSLGNAPLAIMKDIDTYLELAVKGGMLSAEELSEVSQFLGTCKKMKAYLKRAENNYIDLGCLGNSINDVSVVYDEIENAIANQSVNDRASNTLRDIRRQIGITQERVKEKLNSILRGNKTWFADSFITTRNGRLTLPVKKEHRARVSGVVVDTSQTGSTVFIEPEAVAKLQDELFLLQLDCENEIRRILYQLSGTVAEHEHIIKMNIEAMETLDFIFAKAKLSIQMKAQAVDVRLEPEIIIKNGYHPLLNRDTAVPLNFSINEKNFGVIITGPNTGGKTVALKTVGLLQLMIQSGLHIPVDADSFFCMRDACLVDIGDGQSISENLSTFSSHMTNIIKIIDRATPQSIVLLDELGSGTDPAEGMGLAVAILEELMRKGCLIMATTHYPEIKEFAANTKGFINARMAFDKVTLKPLYALEIGEAGESCALYIAKSLGLPERILNRAHEAAYNKVLWGVEPIERKKSVIRVEKKKDEPTRAEKFNLGDAVLIYPDRKIGIVYRVADDKGNLGVQIKKEKQDINHKRLKLHVAASEMYPADYDFSIIFDTVANRKARMKMGKRHIEGLKIESEE